MDFSLSLSAFTDSVILTPCHVVPCHAMSLQAHTPPILGFKFDFYHRLRSEHKEHVEERGREEGKGEAVDGSEAEVEAPDSLFLVAAQLIKAGVVELQAL